MPETEFCNLNYLKNTYHSNFSIQFLPVGGVVGGDRDDGHLPVAFQDRKLLRAANVLSGEDTVEHGHVDVEQDAVKLAMLQEFECKGA